MTPDAPARGVLLIANPGLPDRNFHRSIVLICEHREEGSFGLVLNHDLPMQLSQAVTEIEGWDAPLYRGGPVQENTLHFLHRTAPHHEIGGEEVAPGVLWGGDFERAGELLKSGICDPADFRFFVGYSGWGPGQLENELRHDSWYLAQARGDLVFESDQQNLWRRIVTELGPDYKVFRNFPDDPRFN